jgi:hypothetical protein
VNQSGIGDLAMAHCKRVDFGKLLDDAQVVIGRLFAVEIDWCPHRDGCVAPQFPEERAVVVSRIRPLQEEQQLIAAWLGGKFLWPIHGDLLRGRPRDLVTRPRTIRNVIRSSVRGGKQVGAGAFAGP